METYPPKSMPSTLEAPSSTGFPSPRSPVRAIRSLPLLLLAVLVLAGGALGAGDQPAPQVSVPRFTHPGAGHVFYFVLTDRFANGSTANDAGGIAGGPDASGFDPTSIHHYHGGDFIGLTAKLDYIKRLGATAIWITPPFKNKPVQDGTAGYHGYWILDFTQIDPHLGTDAEFREFVAQAHARGLRVYLDIVVNHTADVIQYRDGTTYRTMAEAPYRDASGRPFDPHAVSYNGLNPASDFPKLSAERSFAHVPFVPPGEAHSKGPEWLNDVTMYHNRGKSTFQGESSQHGDFAGLDDVFTENPAVGRGFIALFRSWIEGSGIDGYRIDTVKHVNMEFWQAFVPAIREKVIELGLPDFLQFGDVKSNKVDIRVEFSPTGTLVASIDFGFFEDALDFVSRGGDAAELEGLFDRDDWYTDHDSNAQSVTTCISNHDAGRFAFFLKQDNPGADAAQLGDLVLLGHELLLTVRGQPVVYYGDEQGMVGIGNDTGAREDMFPSLAPKFRDLALLGTTRRGGDDKFDTGHPFYRAIRTLASLRTSHPGLARGAMLLRHGGQPHLFAFSRIERSERVEYLVALNNSRTETVGAILATSQPAGAVFRGLFDSRNPGLAGGASLGVGDRGNVAVSLAPLECIIWQAQAPLRPRGRIRLAGGRVDPHLPRAERGRPRVSRTPGNPRRRGRGRRVCGGDLCDGAGVAPGTVRTSRHGRHPALPRLLAASGRPRSGREADIHRDGGRPARPPGIGRDRSAAGGAHLPVVRNQGRHRAHPDPRAGSGGKRRGRQGPDAGRLGRRHGPDGIPGGGRRNSIGPGPD